MKLVDEIKKELKEFYEKQIKVFIDKTKVEIKEMVSQVLMAAAQRREKILQTIKFYFNKLSKLYFKYIHPTFIKYWRKLVYLWIVCKHYGKRFCLKIWNNFLFPLLKNVYRFIEFSFNLVKDFIIWAWNKLAAPILQFFQRIFIRCLNQVFRMVRFLWFNILDPIFRYISRGLDIVFNFIAETIWWGLKQAYKVLKIIYPYVLEFFTYLWNEIIIKSIRMISNMVVWIWRKVVVPFCRFIIRIVEKILKEIAIVLRNIGQWLSTFFRYLWTGIKNGVLFFRDCFYVTVGFPIYVYRRITAKAKD